MEYNVPVTKENYNRAVLTSLNGLLKMTKYEMNVVCTMLDKGMIELKRGTRKVIQDSIGCDKFCLNNHILQLIRKGILSRAGSSLQLNPNLLTTIRDGKYTFNFNIRRN